MTRPKTYGEFADTNEYTRVDERLRDREISDGTEDTAIVVSDKFDSNLFQNGVHVDANGNVTRLAENWEDILADLNESGFEL